TQSVFSWPTVSPPGERCRRRGAVLSRKRLALIDRQHALVELEDGQVHRRRIDGADAEAAAALEAAVLGLHLQDALAHGVAVLGPGNALVFLCGAEERFAGLGAHGVH